MGYSRKASPARFFWQDSNIVEDLDCIFLASSTLLSPLSWTRCGWATGKAYKEPIYDGMEGIPAEASVLFGHTSC